MRRKINRRNVQEGARRGAKEKMKEKSSKELKELSAKGELTQAKIKIEIKGTNNKEYLEKLYPFASESNKDLILKKLKYQIEQPGSAKRLKNKR